MRRTMVVSVFAGCGKTWLANHQNKYGYSMRDSDSSTYEKTAGWEKEYVNGFMEEAKSGKYDFVFVCQTESVIDEMDRQKDAMYEKPLEEQYDESYVAKWDNRDKSTRPFLFSCELEDF